MDIDVLACFSGVVSGSFEIRARDAIVAGSFFK
jgi:hypothetical protein